MGVTIKEIAEIAGVSPATVSLVLNNREGVGEQTRNHVKRLLVEHHYVLPQSRKVPARKSVWFLKYALHGMLVEENQGFVSTIIDRIEKSCQKHNIDLVMRHANQNTLEEMFQEVAATPRDGAFLLGTEMGPEQMALIPRLQRPVIVVDSNVDKCPAADSVVMDNQEIIYDALAYFKSLQFQEVGFLSSAVYTQNFEERLTGYETAIKALGLHSAMQIAVTPTLSGAYKDMANYLKGGARLPKAMLAANDSIAIGAMKAVREAGYRIPEDVCMIGIDDITFSAICSPPLTTMQISRTQIGDMAFRTLLDRMKHPDWPCMRIRTGGKLIIRNSTCARV